MALGAGDEVRAEGGARTFITDGIDMDARMEGGVLGASSESSCASTPGCLVAFDPAVDYDIEFVGGIKTALFGFKAYEEALSIQRVSGTCAIDRRRS